MRILGTYAREQTLRSVVVRLSEYATIISTFIRNAHHFLN